jgi:predicted transcriptional regulator YdeE
LEAKVVQREAFKVVGVQLPDAGEDPGLILYAWVALCPKAQLIRNQVQPHLLYGIWYRESDTDKHCYLVGVEVSELEDVPEGLVAFTVPAGKFVTVTHKGNVGKIAATYDAIMEWMKETGAEHSDAATFEVYDTRQQIGGDYEVVIHEPIQ